MSFSQSAISDVRVSRADASLLVTWASSAPDGTHYQVYVNRDLAWSGTATLARLTWPSGPCHIDVGAVSSGADAVNDYSAGLTSGQANRAVLDWQGGFYQSPTLDHFNVYSGTVPGGAVSYVTPVGKVPASPGGVSLDGYGMGGWDQGGYGSAAIAYTWTSGPLAGGTWNFAVKPVDDAGNEAGTPATASVVLTCPPRPPAADANGVRLHVAVNPTTLVPTLTWAASP